MSDDPLSIRFENERRITGIEAKIEILEERLATLKDRNQLTNTKLEEIQEIFSRLKEKDNSLTFSISKLEDDIEDLEQQLVKLFEKVEKIGENDFLKFTADFDMKKLLILVVTIISIITSPSLLTSYLEGAESDQTNERVDKLIELLEKGN